VSLETHPKLPETHEALPRCSRIEHLGRKHLMPGQDIPRQLDHDFGYLLARQEFPKETFRSETSKDINSALPMNNQRMIFNFLP